MYKSIKQLIKEVDSDSLKIDIGNYFNVLHCSIIIDKDIYNICIDNSWIDSIQQEQFLDYVNTIEEMSYNG